MKATKKQTADKHFFGIGLRQILAVLLIGFGFFCFFAGRWYLDVYGQLGFDSILYTLTADLAGVQSDLIKSFVKKVIARVCFATFCVSMFLFIPGRNKITVQLGRKLRFRLFPFSRKAALLAAVLVSSAFIGRAAVDLFPTTLAALGCTIEGERLGLGTNLFSGMPTLMETMGIECFDDEMARYSQYYIDNFYNP